MPAAIDYTGKKIGRVKVLELISRGGGSSKWKCLCDCGHEFICWAVSLKRGEKFECKLCMMERRRGPDLTGRTLGRWTVIKRTVDKNNKTVWHCRCDCGNEGLVYSYALGRKSKSMSCGCWGRKIKSKWANPSLYPKASGLSKTPFYSIRTQIIHKCYRTEWPTYNLFGAKGITVCDLWRNSAKDMYNWAMENGWEKKTCIVLKSGAKEFSPENVYLIHNNDLRSEISKSKACKIFYKGKDLTIREWAIELNISYNSLKTRLSKFPSVDEAFEEPYRKHFFTDNTHRKSELVDLYKSGKTFQELAVFFGVTEQTIHYHLKFLKVDKHAWNRINHVKDQDISKMVEDGMSLNSISKKLGVSWTCIKNRWNRINGIKRKR